jgi:LPS-assembly lipoprotein
MLWSSARTAIRLALVVVLSASTLGCFQPMYGEYSLTGGPGTGLRDKLSAVDVSNIVTIQSRDARLGVELRNGLLFNFNGGGGAAPPTHRLVVRLNTQRVSVIVDVTTSRPDIENYGIDVSYELREIATDKSVLYSTTFARVSYDIPGQQQRFARIRGLRDAESRAVKVIADNISQRLASYFIAGT